MERCTKNPTSSQWSNQTIIPTRNRFLKPPILKVSPSRFQQLTDFEIIKFTVELIKIMILKVGYSTFNNYHISKRVVKSTNKMILNASVAYLPQKDLHVSWFNQYFKQNEVLVSLKLHFCIMTN